jgi:hypothetical protein
MKQIAFGVFLLLILLSGMSAFGQAVRVGPNGEFSEQTLSLPYAFFNESFGFAVGYVYGVVGRPQKQATLLVTVMAGTKGSALGFLELRPFYRSQQINGEDVDEDIKTNGLDFSVFLDNRDFYANPSKGFGLRGKVSRDFGWFDSSNSWTNVEGELDVYIPFQVGDWLRQGVIALDYWTSYSPTWDQQPDGTIDNRPPAYTGSTLGGLWRMRGYPAQRFNDKAAVYYAAELRLIPRWNPFKRWDWLQKYVGILWLQCVPFLEIGRVAPEWSFNRLHMDMKWNAGLGIRAWAKGIVARIDTAYSDEGFEVQMMISQPFQF